MGNLGALGGKHEQAHDHLFFQQRRTVGECVISNLRSTNRSINKKILIFVKKNTKTATQHDFRWNQKLPKVALEPPAAASGERYGSANPCPQRGLGLLLNTEALTIAHTCGAERIVTNL